MAALVARHCNAQMLVLAILHPHALLLQTSCHAPRRHRACTMLIDTPAAVLTRCALQRDSPAEDVLRTLEELERAQCTEPAAVADFDGRWELVWSSAATKLPLLNGYMPNRELLSWDLQAAQPPARDRDATLPAEDQHRRRGPGVRRGGTDAHLRDQGQAALAVAAPLRRPGRWRDGRPLVGHGAQRDQARERGGRGGCAAGRQRSLTGGRHGRGRRGSARVHGHVVRAAAGAAARVRVRVSVRVRVRVRVRPMGTWYVQRRVPPLPLRVGRYPYALSLLPTPQPTPTPDLRPTPDRRPAPHRCRCPHWRSSRRGRATASSRLACSA